MSRETIYLGNLNQSLKKEAMFTHNRKHKAELALLQQKIELLRAQLQHEKYLVSIERERYKKTVLINNRLVGKNLLLREIVTTVAPELGACVN